MLYSFKAQLPRWRALKDHQASQAAHPQTLATSSGKSPTSALHPPTYPPPHPLPPQGDIPASQMLNSIPGVDPARRERLIEVLDIDPNWRMHLVSGGWARAPGLRPREGHAAQRALAMLCTRGAPLGGHYPYELRAAMCSCCVRTLRHGGCQCFDSLPPPSALAIGSTSCTALPPPPSLACRRTASPRADRYGAAEAIPGARAAHPCLV